MGKWGTDIEKEEINYAYKKGMHYKRNRQRRTRPGETTKEQTAKRSTNGVERGSGLHTKQQRKIRYSRTSIIDLDERKKTEKYRAHNQSRR